MSYVEQVLQPGEQIRHVSSIHWIGYWPGVAFALLAAVSYWLSDARLLERTCAFPSHKRTGKKTPAVVFQPGSFATNEACD